MLTLMGFAVGSALTVLVKEGSIAIPHLGRSGRPPAPALTASSPTRIGRLALGASLVGVGSTVIAVASDGVWQSGDEGVTWTSVALPAGSNGVVVDSSDAKHWLGGGPRLMQTRDGGKTWSEPKAQPRGGGPFSPLLISPVNPEVWFVAANGHLVKTHDGGATWNLVIGLPPVPAAEMAQLYSNSNLILATGAQVFELMANGRSVQALPNLPSGAVTRLAALGRTVAPLAIATTDSGHAYLLHSGSWTEVAGGLAGPLDGVLSGDGWLGDGGAKLGAPAKMNVTTDGGTTWKPATGLPPDQTVEAIAASNQTGEIVYAYCSGGDVYRSSDHGAKWRLVSNAFRSA
jgi:photosystem II stability/assembly factor-like uncharacterized protein